MDVVCRRVPNTSYEWSGRLGDIKENVSNQKVRVGWRKDRYWLNKACMIINGVLSLGGM